MTVTDGPGRPASSSVGPLGPQSTDTVLLGVDCYTRTERLVICCMLLRPAVRRNRPSGRSQHRPNGRHGTAGRICETRSMAGIEGVVHTDEGKHEQSGAAFGLGQPASQAESISRAGQENGRLLRAQSGVRRAVKHTPRTGQGIVSNSSTARP